MKKISLLILLCLNTLFLFSQNTQETGIGKIPGSRIYIGIETGIKTYNAVERDYDFIREVASYSSGYYGGYSALSLRSYSSYVAINAEYRSLSNRLWVSTGIQYSTINSSISKNPGSLHRSEYFYILLNQQDNDSYYYRISDIAYKSQYIGIPMDINFSPLTSKYISFFVKLNADLNFRVATDKQASFYHEEMNSKEQEILGRFDEPKNFYATVGFGGGMQIGQKNRANIRLEADLVSVMLTPEAFGLVDQNTGIGCNVSFLIPINNK